MTVEPLASGSAGNAVLLRSGSSALLLDCGLRWSEIQSALGYRAHALEAILLTHEHADHARGVEGALRMGVPVHATAGTLRALGILGHPHAHVASPDGASPAGAWQVLAARVEHDGAREACAWLVGAPDGDRACYVTDAPWVHNRFAGVTHWLIEANYDPDILRASRLDEAQARHVMAGHMSIGQTLALLAANDLSRGREVVLLHLSDRHSDAEDFRLRVEAATGLPCRVAESLLRRRMAVTA